MRIYRLVIGVKTLSVSRLCELEGMLLSSCIKKTLYTVWRSSVVERYQAAAGLTLNDSIVTPVCNMSGFLYLTWLEQMWKWFMKIDSPLLLSCGQREREREGLLIKTEEFIHHPLTIFFMRQSDLRYDMAGSTWCERRRDAVVAYCTSEGN